MKIKTSKGIKDVDEVFPDLESFKNHVLKLDKNIRYDNEIIKIEMESLMVKLKKQEGSISLSLMRGWLVKNYNFKTKKWSNIEYFIERGWSEKNALEEINKRNKEARQRNRLCQEYWINKGYSKEDAIKEISKQQKKSSNCVKTYHGKSKKMLKEKGYSDEEIKRICLTPSNVEFWVNKGYSEGDAKTMVSKNQSNAAQHVDYEKRLIPQKTQYWVNKGYSEDEAKIKVSEVQSTFSLKKCIQKYGEEEGKTRFTERQDKWLSNYTRNNFSKISQELFWAIIETGELVNDEIYFATYKYGELDDSGTNNEYRLKLNTSLVLPDFFVKNRNKIIEFDGTYYHRPTPENVLRESKRDKNIIDSGYMVFHVSESDYKRNKQEIIDKCLEFLNKKY